MSVIAQTTRENVAILTLDRPAQRNAMSQALVAELIEAVQRAGADNAIGAILLAGEGNGFCAGSDLGGLAAMDPAGRWRFEAESGRLARLFREQPKPVVAAAHGFAIGGGLTLAAACDIVVTDAAAKWSLPEVPIGLFPAWGMEAVVTRVGPSIARRLAWGIETLNGEEALRIGLADYLAKEVAAEAFSLAARLAKLPRVQSAAVKTYFLAAPTGSAADILANKLFIEAGETPEARGTFEKFAGKS